MRPEMSKLSTVIYEILKWIERVLLSATLIVVAMQIIMRYFVGKPLSWSEVLARQIFIWMMMLAIPIMFYGRTYLAFDLLLGSLPKKIHNVVQLIVDLLMLTFCVFIVYCAATLIMNTNPARLTPNVKVPYVFMYSSLLISMVLSTIMVGDHVRISIRKCFGKGE